MKNVDNVSTYPLAHTEATKMLAAAVERVQSRTGRTQRDLADALGYKTSVALSHMALGRVPIPIDRAEDIARVLGLDPSRFLIATMQQRHPGIEFEKLLGVKMQDSALASQLESIASVPLDELPERTKDVLRQVVAAANPEHRWLAPSELPIVKVIREHYPDVVQRGLTAAEQHEVLASLAILTGH